MATNGTQDGANYDEDLIARVYAFFSPEFGGHSAEQVLKDNTDRFIDAEAEEDYTTSRPPTTRDTTPEPSEYPDAEAPLLDAGAHLELRFSRPPYGKGGFVFGRLPNSDIKVKNSTYMSGYHFSLDFDRNRRPIIRDLTTRLGTELTYYREDALPQGNTVRRKFVWIIGGDDFLGDISTVVVGLPEKYRLKFRIVVAKHHITSQTYIDKVDKFRMGMSGVDRLLEKLDISLSVKSTVPPSGHTPRATAPSG